jgi:hypothetical protein
MKTKTFIASAAPEGADHLVSAWLAFATTPDDKRKLNDLADLLEREVRLRLPDDSLGSGFGNEADIRQKTCLRLLESHLAGNRELIGATQTRSYAKMAVQIVYSINSALRIERKRAIRKTARELKRTRELTEDNGGSCSHPAGQTYWELPYEIQRELALTALALAVSQRLLTNANAAIARKMIEDDLTEAQVARELGVSRQAVNQQLKRVRKHLAKVVATQELPLP